MNDHREYLDLLEDDEFDDEWDEELDEDDWDEELDEAMESVFAVLSPAEEFYVHEAHRRTYAAPTESTYRAFPPANRSVQVGDIIVMDRGATNVAGVLPFANIPGILPGWALHADIVIHVAHQAHAVAIGGNVSHSVRLKRYPLDSNDHLVVAREQLYTQEPNAGQLPNLPSTNTAPGLDGQSTGRIFTLLSPVPSCVIAPSPLFGAPAT